MMGQFVSKAISVERMLAEAKYSLDGEGPDAILKTKKDVYNQIVRYLDIEGYPTEADAELKEANISDLVYAIINPILFDFRRPRDAIYSYSGRKRLFPWTLRRAARRILL